VAPDVPPLISQEEALELGRITDRAGVEALIDRARKARVERFGDSTDMCSLVHAKSPRIPVDELIDTRREASFWDPASQLRFKRKASVPPRPDGAPKTFPEIVRMEGE
jgi:hypothetical protein